MNAVVLEALNAWDKHLLETRPTFDKDILQQLVSDTEKDTDNAMKLVQYIFDHNIPMEDIGMSVNCYVYTVYIFRDTE